MKILSKLSSLFRCKLEFRKIKKKNLLLFDKLSLELVNSKKRDFEILHTRLEVLNFWIILENLLKFKLTFRNYIITFISKVSPKFILTYNDSDIFFFQLKNYFPSIKLIAVQNGYRHKSQDLDYILKKNKKAKPYVDYLFVFGKSSALYYKKYINCGKFINLGSLRNNKIKLNQCKKNKDILFVPGFRLERLNNKKKDYNVESRLLEIINSFCVENKINLYIAGSSLKDYQAEKDYYFSKLSKSNNVKFIKRDKKYSSYFLINKFDTIVFVDSTLGYEAIGRKKKIIAISCRRENNKIINPFGYPMIKKNKDFYFTNFDSRDEILRVLNNVYFLSTNEWNKKYYSKLKNIMCYSKNNRKLNFVINKIL